MAFKAIQKIKNNNNPTSKPKDSNEKKYSHLSSSYHLNHKETTLKISYS